MQKGPDNQLQVVHRTLRSPAQERPQALQQNWTWQEKKTVKKFNNVLSKPVWNVNLKNVCPPYLHVLLGVVKRHHDLLEKDGHNIDLMIW